MSDTFTPRMPGFTWDVQEPLFSGELDTLNSNPLFESQRYDPDWQCARQIALSEDEMAAYADDPERPVDGRGDPVHVGIDAEWEYDPVTITNRVLSYQFYLICPAGTLAGIVYPNSPDKRLDFARFLGGITHRAMQAALIDAWPRVIFVYAHFLRADLTHFGSFWKTLKHEVDTLRGTVTSLKGDYRMDVDDAGSKPYRPDPLVLRDEYRHARRTYVKFIDTQLLTPDRMSLAQVGELIGLPKLSLPDGYTKDKMSRLLAEQPEAFSAYALRDAEIAVRYGLRMRQFVQDVLEKSVLPPTLSILAVRLFLRLQRQASEADAESPTHRFDRLFGFESIIKDTAWHTTRQRIVNRTEHRHTTHRLSHEAFITRCYHGGRNECFMVGPTSVGLWSDIDLTGAYTTALVDLRPLDYARSFLTHRIEDFLGPVCGFAQVRFRFDPATRFPCLPVRAGQRGLYFPLEGVSYCTAAELALAHRLGATLLIEHGVIVPWCDSDERLFESFVRTIRAHRQRAKAGGNVFMNTLIKEVGNSLYGKLAQGLVDKTQFDTRTGHRTPTPRSQITHPTLAAHVTGFIRALVGELIAGVPDMRTVVSVTTDGFLTDTRLDEVDLSGPLMQRFQALIARLDDVDQPSPSAGLECKHQVAQVVSMRTRGLVTALPYADGPPILAKASVKPPILGLVEQNQFLLDLYLNRTPGQTLDQEHLISTAEQWKHERDLIAEKRTLRLNLEFDFKREPINPRLIAVAGVTHLAFDTRPWPKDVTGLQARAWFDAWRANNVLKTLEDFAAWQTHYRLRLAAGRSRVQLSGARPVDLLKRFFLRAYAQGVWGTQRTEGMQTYADVAHWLTGHGYDTRVDDLKNAKRAKLVAGLIPVDDPAAMALWEVLLERQPMLQYAAFFAAPSEPDAPAQLAA